MSVNLNVSDFSADFFTLDQESKPADADQFLKGLNVLASRALDALSRPEDVELAFQMIKNVNLVVLSPQDKTSVVQRIQDVFNTWVKVSFGNQSRYVPRERLAEQCGPKFHAQYTSGMKEATDRELDLQSLDPSSTDRCPEECKALFLVYLQTGVLPPGTLGDNALNMLVLAEQHQFEGLIQECLVFLIDNLTIENLDTFLEFTQQSHYPQLEVACLDFMKTNRDAISEELRTKYQDKFSIVEALANGKITLTISSSGKTEALVESKTGQTADSLQKINKQFPITSLIFPRKYQYDIFGCLKQIAPTLNNLQELIFYKLSPNDSNLPKLKNLFPNLIALGNDAPLHKTFDEVKTYVKNFRGPGEDDQDSNKPLLRSLNLKKVPNLTDDQLEELTPYLQELYHLFIESDKITSVVAPEATWAECTDCTKLKSLAAPKATEVHCWDCTQLTTLEVPKATWIKCGGCTQLTTLKAPEATRAVCYGCTALTTYEAPKVTKVACSGCTALSTFKAPKATEVDCGGCTALATLEAPKATTVDCKGCTALIALEAPKATSVVCESSPKLTTLAVPKATFVYCRNCTTLTTLKTPKATRIDCWGCTGLTTIKAPKVTRVECWGCTKLTTIKAPKVTWVSYDGCTALATLEMPKATWVGCRGCTRLKTLEVPEATSVNCEGCTKLRTLKAPKAIWICCRGCKRLTTLEAPRAIELNCSGCTKLITLKTNKATKVHRKGCTELILKSPEANSFGV